MLQTQPAGPLLRWQLLGQHCRSKQLGHASQMTNATNAQERLRHWVPRRVLPPAEKAQENQTKSFAVTGNTSNLSRGAKKWFGGKIRQIRSYHHQRDPIPPFTKGVTRCYRYSKEKIYIT